MKEFIVKKQTTEWAVIWADSKKDAVEKARTETKKELKEEKKSATA